MEADEESGSADVNYWLDQCKDRIGPSENVKLILLSDAGAGSYDRFWINTSLRGCLTLKLTIEVAT